MAMAVTSSTFLPQSLAMEQPKANPSQGRPMPVRMTFQSMILNM